MAARDPRDARDVAVRLGASAYYPTFSLSLLLKAALRPCEDEAREAWSKWEATFGGGKPGADETRLLAAVARRLRALGVETSLLPELFGIVHFMSSRRQRQLEAARPHLQALQEAGIVPLVTKGTARVALDPRVASERVSADVDLLVPRSQWEMAVDILIRQGLRPGWPRERIVHQMREWRHSIDFMADDVGIDLHQSALFPNRCIGDDDAMWARAIKTSLSGVPILVPAAADRLVMAICHGLQYSSAQQADWVLDAVDALHADDFDWSVAEDEIKARGISAAASVGLAYIAEELRQTVPSDLRARLKDDVGPHFAEEFDSIFHSYAPHSSHAMVARYLAQLERAERAAKRQPRRETPPLPGTWESVAEGVHDVRLAVPDAVNPHRLLRLDLKLPAVRTIRRRRLQYRPALQLRGRNGGARLARSRRRPPF